VLLRFQTDYVWRLLIAAKGNVSLAARMAKIDRKQLWRLIRKTGIRIQRDEPAPARKSRDWAAISARLTDGRVVTVETSDPIGSPDKPLSCDSMRAKFRDCAANAVQPIGAAVVEAALDRLEGLDEMADIGVLTRIFA